MAYLGIDPKVAYSSYRNIDDISASFDGLVTTFPLTVGGLAPTILPINEQQVLINVGGVPQQPDPTGVKGFKLFAGNIVFSSAPSIGETFWGVILATANYISANTRFAAGSASLPSVTFASDVTTGIYSPGAGQLAISAGGTERAVVDSNGVTIQAQGDLRLADSDNSNWVALQAPATVATNLTLTVPAADGTADQALVTNGSGTLSFTDRGRMVLETAKNATGIFVDFPGIPSWVKRISVMFSGISLSGSSDILIQLGDSGGIETTGYNSVTSVITLGPPIGGAAALSANGFIVYASSGPNRLSGTVVFNNVNGNLWLGNGQWTYLNVNLFTAWVSGEKSLSNPLDRIRITSTNGTDTLDAGTINIIYEG